MKVTDIAIRNFRRLQDVRFSLEEGHTIFVGPNNSGKTAVATAFRVFLDSEKFSFHDFNVSCIDEFNRFAADRVDETLVLPKIELDLWLSIDPDTEFGSVFALLSTVAAISQKVGLRLCFSVNDPEKLIEDYGRTFPSEMTEGRKSLAEFLALPGVLLRNYSVKYYSLREDETQVPIGQDEGKKVLRSLIRIDFIDAQRNIHDRDIGRQNRLSTAFAEYYTYNLEKPEENRAANKVISDNNTQLTNHYEIHFKPLLATIAKLGVPAVHDRNLKLRSTLSAEEALKGSTELFYVDAVLHHELPETYNGLGFKNLIYMVVQVSHYYTQWLKTEKNREQCQIIFIEEPEVHLHAQVLQTFITNIDAILQETAKALNETYIAPQLAISTHSSHIVDTVEFEKIRYFRRCPLKDQTAEGVRTLNASKVLSLKDFRPEPGETIGVVAIPAGATTEEVAAAALEIESQRAETLNFLKKYMRLTHCDLFFADAAVLVEGSAEKLLMPQMVEACAKGLKSRFVTVLEVGGAHAHKLAGLLEFLGLLYLVVSDIDTVDPANARSACRADTAGSRVSNGAIRYFLDKQKREDLLALEQAQQVVAKDSCFVAFQRPVNVLFAGAEHLMHGRTFEEAFVYDNLESFISGKLPFTADLTTFTTAEELRDSIYAQIRSPEFKKTEFALDMAARTPIWRTPAYIEAGLKWLDRKLQTHSMDQAVSPAGAST